MAIKVGINGFGRIGRMVFRAAFKNFKDMMWDKRLVLFDYPIPDGQGHCDYIQELLELQAEVQSKYVISVEAPKIEGKHDDRSDALVRMVWAASQKLGKRGTIVRGQVGAHQGVFAGAGGNSIGGTGRMPARIMRNAKRMGSSPDRGSNIRRRSRRF